MNTFVNVEQAEKLLPFYREDERTQRIKTHFGSSTSTKLHLSGLRGAQDSFVLWGLFHNQPTTHLYIASDKEEAAYMQNNLDSLFGENRIQFFPDSFKRPMQFEEINPSNAMIRTETVNHISHKTGDDIIVTYPEALFEQVVDPNALLESRIRIDTGESLDVDTMIDILVEYGFDRVDFVYEPGQFSIRGGIIDIFSYGNEWPYRIELFDDEVESIRSFDPTSQLSKRNISSVSIIPNVHTRFGRDDKVPFLNIFPENTVVWIRNTEMLTGQLHTCREKAEELADLLKDGEDEQLRDIFREQAFSEPEDVMEALLRFNILFIDHNPGQFEIGEIIEYKSQPQPSFNKNFKLLIEDLQNHRKEGHEIYLFTDNAKQVERFRAIFEDLHANVSFNPVLKPIHQGFIDKQLGLVCYTDHQIFERFHRYRLKKGFTSDMALNLKMLRELKPGDFVTHIDHGVGRYSGLEKIDINGHVQESVRLIYKNNDILYVSINSLHKISKYTGKEGTKPTLNKLGSDSWKNLKRKTKKKVKNIAGELIKLYSRRKAAEGFAFQPDGYMQNELEASFIYEDTPDQLTATNDVKEDMMKPFPMDRLICGDVGFGKTEVAIRAAFKAVLGGKQVAILVPTTILALQHYRTLKERLGEFGCTVDYINRFRTAKERRIVSEKLASGEIDIVIGTHGLLNKSIKFKDLGLLVIDEEQKFGVASKEKLRKLKVNVDTLTLTATPIPRTLQFSLMAARDLSIIRTAPPNRQPIHTEIRVFNEGLIKEAIYYEIHRGGQVFFVHNRVKTLGEVAAMIRRMCPDVDVAVAHGQMEAKQLEETLIKFIDRRYDVLVCTNIIETGLDIPNANTIMINNAHQFGLSDLHQLRGRVGRSNKRAFCYLFCPPMSTLTPDARKRLKTLEEFSDLGSGFHIAMRDLDIRGAGNLLGAEQSGFITDIGYETYQKILDEAIQELKENEFRDLFRTELENMRYFVREVQIDTDVEMMIPDEYVNVIQERLNLYTELDQIENEEGLEAFSKRMRDRFGPIPESVNELFEGLRLRWIAREMGFERITLKNDKLRCYFISNQQSPFYETELFRNLLKFVGLEGKEMGLSFKHSAKYFLMIKDGVNSLTTAKVLLKNVLNQVRAEAREASSADIPS